jgi:activator of HSP90 ATPase
MVTKSKRRTQSGQALGWIRQRLFFPATPREVYDLLMDAKLHSQIAGSKVTMSPKTGGHFRVFDGYCTGRNLELVPGNKIVQSWHFVEPNWPKEHYSTCSFLLVPSPRGTYLSFEQTGIPLEYVASLKRGWKEYYWTPMKAWAKDRQAIS